MQIKLIFTSKVLHLTLILKGRLSALGNAYSKYELQRRDITTNKLHRDNVSAKPIFYIRITEFLKPFAWKVSQNFVNKKVVDQSGWISL